MAEEYGLGCYLGGGGYGVVGDVWGVDNLEGQMPLAPLPVKGSRPRPAPPQVISPDLPIITGVQKKPMGCAGCEYSQVGVGFCADERPAAPRIAWVLEAPGGDEILEGRPLWGRAGQRWLWQLVVRNGYKREDVLLCSVLRCRPRGNGDRKAQLNDFPTGKLREEAERNCRQYDERLKEFAPDTYVVTLHPKMLLTSAAMTRLVKKDVKLAFDLAERGRRVAVLMGDKAMHLVAPWLKNGVKGWRGHWWYAEKGWRTKYEN